ncbi:uncharacterized protein CC84DRAFT_415707 [Paraphaeosphaeria sporulosa]|uniref:Uncharacterized protein n=1 Tax=Paraphaeosphaeria sporulosa TaxID=1460663 RepID=A0A177BX37_9PLEO|nr:uncharacterized protein CC84DRAFT_415707 [Paraphaeosphaeria sporulosa]OAF99077.1 hypothetical protein CC84DRAFT_415707 [Paraphaeosphaeria sporulosa]
MVCISFACKHHQITNQNQTPKTFQTETHSLHVFTPPACSRRLPAYAYILSSDLTSTVDLCLSSHAAPPSGAIHCANKILRINCARCLYLSHAQFSGPAGCDPPEQGWHTKRKGDAHAHPRTLPPCQFSAWRDSEPGSQADGFSLVRNQRRMVRACRLPLRGWGWDWGRIRELQ